MTGTNPPSPICEVAAIRLNARGDINESYSADRIGTDKPMRKPFRHVGELWVCTGIWGSALTGSGQCEHEAYRLVPERSFQGLVTSYNEKTGTSEAAEAARNDANGFYHAMKVQFAAAAFVMCGPPVRFIAATRPEPEGPEPAQLSLF